MCKTKTLQGWPSSKVVSRDFAWQLALEKQKRKKKKKRPRKKTTFTFSEGGHPFFIAEVLWLLTSSFSQPLFPPWWPPSLSWRPHWRTCPTQVLALAPACFRLGTRSTPALLLQEVERWQVWRSTFEKPSTEPDKLAVQDSREETGRKSSSLRSPYLLMTETDWINSNEPEDKCKLGASCKVWPVFMLFFSPSQKSSMDEWVPSNRCVFLDPALFRRMFVHVWPSPAKVQPMQVSLQSRRQTRACLM